MATITWVQDVNGNYEISSPEHLKQLMNKGTLYTDAGTPPSDYWGSSTNYIQTADIDLLNDNTDIKPIGIDGDHFYGSYDGGEYSISNYSYLDPNFSTGNSCEKYVGLFGYFRGIYIKNIRLNGVWTIEGFSQRVGFLAGYFTNASSGIVSNIEGNFSTGSFINTNNVASDFRVGSLFGYIRPFDLNSVTLRGSIDFMQDTTKTSYTGGIAGYFYLSGHNASASMIRNLATFPSGMGGRYVGGIFAFYLTSNQNVSINNIINCMIGDIFSDHTSSQHIGGIIGYMNTTMGTTFYSTNIINSMTGDIYASASDASIGGVVGHFRGCGTVRSERLLNYMTGNIYMTGSNTSSIIGGLIGNLHLYYTWSGNEYYGKLFNCINAMNGSVDGDALFGYVVPGAPVPPTNIITNTSFGLTFSANAFNTGTPTGLLTNTEFTDLPYVDLTGTDTDGNPYDFEFVYGNLSGNSSFSDYTHLVLHRGDIYTPYEVTYGLPSNNTTVYLTYINAQTMIVSSPSGLTGSTTVSGVSIVFRSLIDISVRSINLLVTIDEISGATQYQITYEGPTGGEVVAFAGATDLSYNITGLDPDTQYTIKLYADTGAGFEVQEEVVATTLSNDAANYDLTDFEVNGVTDLSSLEDASNLVAVVTDLFTTGDLVSLQLTSEGGGDSSSVTTTYVDLGETTSIQGIGGLLLPFQDTAGSGQTVSLTLSDATTTVPVVYDEVAKTITVESSTHSAGDTFVLDGKVVEVFDYSGLMVLSVEDLLPSTVTPRSIDVPVVISEYPGATAYQITYEGPADGGEILVISGTTDLEHSIVGVEPETEYTVNIYADTGTEYELIEQIVTTTLPNVASNYEVSAFQDTNGVIDLTSMDEATLSHISSVLLDLVNTGDAVNIALSETETLSTSVVKAGETITLTEETTGILLPFSTSSGAGQTVSLTLSDATTVPVVYDEVANTITVDSVSHGTGDIFFLDGKKLEVSDYQSLTVVSVKEASMIITPKPVNIHVLITEVPGFVWYKLTYEDSTGKVTTALQNVTTLQHNVIGLVSSTEYTFKLYVDTGSGYVLTETLTITTLPNVAQNYDVEDLKKDSVIELVSLPQSTIRDISEVMNEIFSTGDVVEVSVKNKGSKKSSTSFINLGDTLSIKEVDGVLLPFLPSSGTGQDVFVELSDGSTTVGIEYNDVVNSITVGGVVYYAGDSFVLDGKKVSVVDYSEN